MALVSPAGMRRTMDMASRFYRVGLPVYLRVTTEQADRSAEQYAQLGFAVAASGAEVTQDILIDPPPQVTPVTLRDVGLNAGQLNLGDNHFLISHTWVLNRQKANDWYDAAGNPDFVRVFRDSLNVGFFYDSRVWKIISFTHDDLGSQPWLWDVLASAVIQPSVG